MTIRHSRGPGRTRPCVVPRPTDVSSAAESPSHWVRVTCPKCGVLRVLAGRVVVRNCVDDHGWSYRARCSRCDTVFVRATPESLALPAVAAGVAFEFWTLPQPSVRRSGAPLGAVDVLELHLALLESDWFDQWEREPLDGR
jgi:hypothetical protein